MKNEYINNRLRMNIMIKKNLSKKNNIKKTIKRNNSSQRYLNMYQNEKSNKKILLTPDINKKSIKKTNIIFHDQFTLDNTFTNLLGENEDNINNINNINLLSNSFDISKSFVNIEDYMNLYYNSKNKNPFINKENEVSQNKSIKKIKKEEVICKYSYKNKNWLLIEQIDEDNNINNNLFWREYSNDEVLKENNINDIKDFNILEEKYNSIKLEYNKIKQMFNDLNNKYEQINKKNKESQIQLNYYLLKIKKIEKDKEKYLKKNKKLKEEINKIPFLIEKEMNKFKEEAGRKISKKIFELEQENTILKGERYKSDENRIQFKIFEEYEFLNGNDGKEDNNKK